MRRAVIASSVVLALGVAACSLLTSYSGLEGASPDGGAACVLRGPPPRPLATPDGPSLAPSVVAFRTLTFGTAEAPQLGFDLDRRCTCPDVPSCVATGTVDDCDGEGGVDNASQKLFLSLVNAGPSISDRSLTEGIELGLYGLLVRISGYSGAPDDPHVRFELLNALGVEGGGRPTFDGAERWTLDATGVKDDLSQFTDLDAYVAGDVVVASIPVLLPKLRLFVGPGDSLLIDLRIEDAHLSARIVHGTGGQLALSDGQLTGRVRASSWLTQLQRYGRCASDPSFASARALLCAYADLRATAAEDGRGLPCDAVSLGVGFTATTAFFGAAAPPTDKPSSCERDGGTIERDAGCP